jgi:DNA ligase-1
MLAASAGSVSLAMTGTSPQATPEEVIIDAKVDGVRAQVHVHGDLVTIFSRTLDDMTDRLPEIVAQVRRLKLGSAILDGEVVAMDDSGRPRPFQETGAQVARAADNRTCLSLLLFDLLHLDGSDVIDLPLRDRLRRLDAVAGDHVVRRVTTADAQDGEEFFRTCVQDGFEGVVVKRADAPYVAGRRGGDWIKVKPVRTVDLVVLGVEWGSGRRTGMLSNIHLGARDADGDGFVMVGKTFKGMTDAMLTWQTDRFLELEQGREGHVVWTRPEQVVEIAFDAVQRSRRYPGGVALRFARVVRYRDDKHPGDTDTIQSLQAIAPTGSGQRSSPDSSAI